MATLSAFLFKAVDNSPLIVFRMLFGLIVTCECWGAILTGWVRRTFIIPKMTFPFIGFEWLQPLPGNGMYYYFIVMGLLGLLITVGCFYRVSTWSFAFLWSGVYLMQKTNYNNHYYLLLLLSFFMALVPAHRYCSVDVKRRPDLQSEHCPNWCIWIFIVQIWIVYTYASIAKLYPDWLDGSAIASLLSSKTHDVLIGGLLGQKWFQLFLAYGGILFDLLIVPALLWQRTFKLALGVSVLFHLFNSIVFQIGVFPYMALAFNVFFFEAETIRSHCLKCKPPVAEHSLSPYPRRSLVMYGLAIYVLLQILIPLRHYAIAGDVTWTEEGHRHAWRMMLRSKIGIVRVQAVDRASARQWKINLRDYLTPMQMQKIATRPDMLWQFCQFLKAHFAQQGMLNVSLYAHSRVRLNGHPYRPLYDSTFDLARVDWHHWRHNSWITRQRHLP